MKILRAIDAGFDRLLSATGALAVGLMVLLSIMVFLLSFFRYVLGMNASGLFDGAVYSLTVFPFLTAAYTMREGRHITIDAITEHLSRRTRAVLNIAVYLVSLIYVIVLGWQSAVWMADALRRGIHTQAEVPIPLGILLSTMVFGCVLLLWQIIRLVFRAVRSLPAQAASPGLRHSPWLVVAIFVAGIVAGLLLLKYVSPVGGISVLALVLLFSGMPVFLGLGLVGVLGIYFLLGTPSLMQVPMTAYQAVSKFPLTCLPLFILGGLIMEKSGISQDLFHFFELWGGRFRGAPLMVTITVGLVFCAISGSSVATTAVVAAVALPLLAKRGFDKALSCGVVGGATVGSLIPPSIGYVVFAVLTGESIAKLFMAGLVPGLLLFVFYYIYIYVLAQFRPKSLYEGGQIPPVAAVQVTWGERISSLKTAAWGLLAPVVILGGIYFAVYTPTEAAGVLVVYAVAVSLLVKKVKWQAILKHIVGSVSTSSMILCILLGAFVFAALVSQTRTSAALVAYAKATGMTSDTVLLILFALLIILGLFLEAASMKVITLPIFFPLALAVGINPLWLGVFYQFLSEIGLLTPPVGLNLFVMQGVTGLPLSTVVKGNLPFILMMLLVVVLMYFFPQMVAWLPSTMK